MSVSKDEQILTKGQGQPTPPKAPLKPAPKSHRQLSEGRWEPLSDQKAGSPDGPEKPPSLFKFDTWLWYFFLSLWLAMMFSGFIGAAQTENIPYSAFMNYVQEGKVDDVVVAQQDIRGTFKDEKAKVHKFRTVRIEDPQLASRLNDHKVKFQGELEDTLGKALLSWVVPLIILMGIWSLIASKMASKDGFGGMGPGMGLMSIEKSRAKVYMESNIKITFEDVAGVDEAKEELQEVIGFLKEPDRYNRLGGHLPKGILLVGPPGTGKTLLAR
ncbi:MAG TPA: ATP-dependent metallopeptidase FtsH/Yme1/Tma family protein, partial [Candidatus Obscuribacter sp.]|nr:ATP-dependent metallopeptidase FtsH/Yme1/Tma family protein [Candidatus Obscuribacter sp.]